MKYLIGGLVWATVIYFNIILLIGYEAFHNLEWWRYLLFGIVIAIADSLIRIFVE